jgi:hypothetical protein
MITAEILKQKLEDDLFSAAIAEYPSVKSDYAEAVQYARLQAIKRAAEITAEFHKPQSKKDSDYLDIYNIYKEL